MLSKQCVRISVVITGILFTVKYYRKYNFILISSLIVSEYCTIRLRSQGSKQFFPSSDGTQYPLVYYNDRDRSHYDS